MACLLQRHLHARTPARPPARTHARTHPPTHARTRARAHARTHARTVHHICCDAPSPRPLLPNRTKLVHRVCCDSLSPRPNPQIESGFRVPRNILGSLGSKIQSVSKTSCLCCTTRLRLRLRSVLAANECTTELYHTINSQQQCWLDANMAEGPMTMLIAWSNACVWPSTRLT